MRSLPLKRDDFLIEPDGYIRLARITGSFEAR